MLADLLATRENWSARDTLTRALDQAADEPTRTVLHDGLNRKPEAYPLDALRAGSELVAPRRRPAGCRRRDGSSWEQVATALDTTVEQVRSGYLTAVQNQERHGISDVTAYREVL